MGSPQKMSTFFCFSLLLIHKDIFQMVCNDGHLLVYFILKIVYKKITKAEYVLPPKKDPCFLPKCFLKLSSLWGCLKFSILPFDIVFNGLIRFCQSARKTKSLKLDLKIKDGILRRLKNHRVLSTNNEHLRISSLCPMASFNSKSNFNIFICFWKWQNLIGPFREDPCFHWRDIQLLVIIYI